MRTVKGKTLKPGDTIEVWWAGKRDTIKALRPYTGRLLYLFPEGAQLAEFMNGPEMTIDNADVYELIEPEGP